MSRRLKDCLKQLHKGIRAEGCESEKRRCIMVKAVPVGLAKVEGGVVEAHAAARGCAALLLRQRLVAPAPPAGLLTAADVERVNRRRRRPRARRPVQRHVLHTSSTTNQHCLSAQSGMQRTDTYFSFSPDNALCRISFTPVEAT